MQPYIPLEDDLTQDLVMPLSFVGEEEFIPKNTGDQPLKKIVMWNWVCKVQYSDFGFRVF